jgi:PAS domain S-box-containing protein
VSSATAIAASARLRILLVALWLAAPLLALEPGRRITQYNLDHWSLREGLVQGTIQALAQTPDGYLWLGTRDGLIRFDGIRFEPIPLKSPKPIGNRNVSSLAVSPDGTLWVGLSEDGVLAIGPRAAHLTQANGLASNSVRSLLATSDGALWVGTLHAGVTVVKDGRSRTFGTSDGLPSGTVRALAHSTGDAVWVGTDLGAVRVAGSTVLRPDFAAALGPVLVNALLEESSGRVWIGTGGSGVFRWEGGRMTRFDEKSGLAGDMVRDLRLDRHGNLWVATSLGLSRWHGDGFDSFRAKDGLSHDYVRVLFEDRENNLWIGLFGGGLNRFKDGKFLNWGGAEGMAAEFVYVVMEARNGDIWAGTNGGGAARLRDGHFLAIGKGEGLPGNSVPALGEGNDGTIYLGLGPGGLFSYTGGRLRRVPIDPQADTSSVAAVQEAPDGALWMLCDAGAYVRRQGVWSRIAWPHDGPRSFTPAAISFSRDNNVWVSGLLGVARLVNGAFVLERRPDGQLLPKTHALAEDGQGRIWAATNGQGLMVRVGGQWKTIGAAQGVRTGVIYAIVDDQRGTFWLTSDQGLFAVPVKELQEVADGKRPTVMGRLYGSADGMRSSECNGGGGGMPAGWLAHDGRIWIPTVRGLSVVDPSHLHLNRLAPGAIIEDVTVGENVMQPTGRLDLGPGVSRLRFRFTSPSLESPEAVRFQYRLDGVDRDWVDDVSRRAYYTNLAPGQYRFRLRAVNSDGERSPTEDQVAVYLRSEFYQTPLFRLFATAFLGALIAWFWQFRSRQIRSREYAAALKEANLGLEQRVAERTQALDAANHQLQAQKENYETVFNLVPVQIWLKDKAGRILRVNPQVEKDIGLPAGELEGREMNALFPSYADRYSATDREVVESGSPQLNLPEEITGAGGRQRVLRTDKIPVRTPAGQVTGLIAFSQDVTEREKLEQQLRQAQRLESIGRLAGGIAHDFNNLLTVINGYTELLAANSPPGSSQAADLAQVHSAGRRAAVLTQQLLTFSRRQHLHVQRIQLNTVIRDMTSLLSTLIGEDIRLTSMLEPDLPEVHLDHGQAEQIFLNLSLNARDAMPVGGVLSIQTRFLEAVKLVELQVTDNGLGMDEVVRQHAFEPFYTTKGPGKGTGLGLATVYGIVTQSGGQIEVDSRPGQGCTFRILLPAAEPETPASGPDMPPPAASIRTAAGQRIEGTILLVEDQAEVRRFVGHLLHHAGAAVLSAGSAQEALQLWSGHNSPIAMLITDQVMPGMRGSELAAILVGEQPGLPVLIMSGYDESEFNTPGLVADRIQKPFQPADLLARVAEMLGATSPD